MVRYAGFPRAAAAAHEPEWLGRRNTEGHLNRAVELPKRTIGDAQPSPDGWLEPAQPNQELVDGESRLQSRGHGTISCGDGRPSPRT
jgi:hypothetical protein